MFRDDVFLKSNGAVERLQVNFLNKLAAFVSPLQPNCYAAGYAINISRFESFLLLIDNNS
jgi:hypothetical protein